MRRNFGLCSLPNELLIRILCLLPMRDAIVTCFLSKRWQHLWTMIPRLQADETQFVSRNRFMSFVEAALSHRDRQSCLVSFSLSCKVFRDTARINTWITAAIWCNVEELCLILDSVQDSLMLPCFTFMCNTLKKLHIEMEQTLLIPSATATICFPRLKHLTLKGVKFLDDESTQKLLSSPLLEELIMEWCDWVNVKSVTVTAPNLQNLIVYDLVRCPPLAGNFERKVWIVGATKLKTFCYFGEFTNEFCIFGTCEQLTRVEIWMAPQPQHLELNVAAMKRGYKLFNGVSFVRILTLSDDLLEALEGKLDLLETIPFFNYLAKLNLVGDIRINTSVFLKILERCPHLENLEIHRATCFDKSLLQLIPLPSCFETHLKKVTIFNFRHTAEDYHAVNVLLRNGGDALKEMIIHYRNGFNKHEVQDYLNRLAAQTSCNISLVGRNKTAGGTFRN